MKTSVWEILKEEKWIILLIIGLGVFWSIMGKSVMSIKVCAILIPIGIVVVIICSLMTQKIGSYRASMLLLAISFAYVVFLIGIINYYGKIYNVEFTSNTTIAIVMLILVPLTMVIIVAMRIKYYNREQKIKELNQQKGMNN